MSIMIHVYDLTQVIVRHCRLMTVYEIVTVSHRDNVSKSDTANTHLPNICHYRSGLLRSH